MSSQDSALSIHPMDQFEIRPLIGDGDVHWYTISNATLWLLLSALAVFLVMAFGTRRAQLVPSRAQSLAEMAYLGVFRMIIEICGEEGRRYFAPVMTLFCFILSANLLGLIPMGFTTTSHIAVTGFLAISVFLSVTVLGLVRNGGAFLGMFWPSSAPLALRPVLSIIEVISYFVRPVSHSIRLAANLMAGHAVIKVFAAFAAVTIAAPFAIVGVVAMYAFEVAVAGVQAYVFTILTCVYLKDALHPAH